METSDRLLVVSKKKISFLKVFSENLKHEITKLVCPRPPFLQKIEKNKIIFQVSAPFS